WGASTRAGEDPDSGCHDRVPRRERLHDVPGGTSWARGLRGVHLNERAQRSPGSISPALSSPAVPDGTEASPSSGVRPRANTQTMPANAATCNGHPIATLEKPRTAKVSTQS